MRNSGDSEQYKRTVRKGATRVSGKKAQDTSPKPEKKVRERLALQDESTSSPTGHILTQEEFRAHVARKAFELYVKRQAITEVDDWLEAERLIRMQLLTEEQGAGSV